MRKSSLVQTGHAVFDAKVASLEQHLRDRRRQWILLKSELGIEILTIFEENNRLLEKTAMHARDATIMQKLKMYIASCFRFLSPGLRTGANPM